jgi:hypothetical protein
VTRIHKSRGNSVTLITNIENLCKISTGKLGRGAKAFVSVIRVTNVIRLVRVISVM